MPYKDRTRALQHYKYHARLLQEACLCRCGIRDRQINKTYCTECLAKFSKRQVEKQRQRMQDGLCRGCGGIPEDGRRDCPKCLQNQAKLQNRRGAKNKLAALNAYGGVICAKCGVNNPIVLTIDHVDNNGAAERKILNGHGTGSKFYAWLKHNGYPPGYQVLCMNCNWLKYYMSIGLTVADYDIKCQQLSLF